MDNVIIIARWPWFWPVVKAILLVVAGYFIAKIISKTASKLIRKHASKQQTMILNKIIYFGILILFIISALQQLHFQLTVLLGSAGIATAAIGFASKTTISNMISGIFLIIEKSFTVGDTIKIKGITGVVNSIDLLSVKLTTFEHTLVRIPNETIISSELINLTHYPYRRLDIMVGVSYSEDIQKVKKTLLLLAEKHVLSLESPPASVRILAFADSAINVRLSVYVNKNHFSQLNVELHDQIKSAFEKENIDIPFPQLCVHIEEAT